MSKPLTRLSLSLMAASLAFVGCQSAPAPVVTRPSPSASASSPTPQASVTPEAPGKPENADLGFRSNPNGFKFENGSSKPYDPKVPGTDYLTIKGMQKMFGDEHVCTGHTSGANCVPTPEAKKWHDKINSGMNNGQCEGLAVLALSVFKGIDQPSLLEAGKSTTFDLDYGSAVRETVGLYYAYQFTDQVVRGTVKGTPTEVLSKLTTYLKNNQKDPVTLGFYGETGGHATTPYAIEDKGNGIFHIKMYDNNWPNQERYIEVDTKANAWIYNFAALNPTEAANAWKGDASTFSLEFTPLSTRLQKAVCPYCNSGNDSSEMRQIFLTAGASGRAHIRVVDVDDPSKYIGWDAASGKYVNHLAGAAFVSDKSVFKVGGIHEPPIIEIPDHHHYEIKIDGHSLPSVEDVSISIFGQGKSLELKHISLDPHQEDTLDLGADDDSFSYTPGHSADTESPMLSLTYDDPNGADYDIEVQHLHAVNGEALKADFSGGKLLLGDDGDAPDEFDIEVLRYEDDGHVSDFSKQHVKIGAHELDEVDFADWGGEGQGMMIGELGHPHVEPDVDSEKFEF